MKIVKCPHCQRDSEYNTSNPHRPFCSERCQLIDLGEWADEKYKIESHDNNIEEFMEDVEDTGEPGSFLH